MAEDKINSSESEGIFNDFIRNRMEDLIENIISDGDLSSIGGRESEIIVEMEDILPPRFVYGDDDGGQGGGGEGPGKEAGRISFSVSYEMIMQLIAEKLKLPRLLKDGRGKIKEVSYEFKTYGPAGIILDKKRTFKRALKSSIATGRYRPQENNYDVQFRRKDRRYKLPERVEKPRYKAVVFYIGDISYSTYGERLKLEKRIVNFILNWLNFNYGADKVEHRYFVHDSEAHEVMADQFFTVSNAGGTQASVVFDLVSQVARNEYEINSTNFYAFYFGDGEIFHDDAEEIIEIISSSMLPFFSRIGICEVKPSGMSQMVNILEERFEGHPIVRLTKLREPAKIKNVICDIFR